MLRDSKQTQATIYAYEKGYRVTDEGNVISPTGSQLKSRVDTRGYKTFSGRYEGKKRNIQVHQLAAYQQYGEEALYEGIQVRHLNGNATDNSLVNIAIGTPRDNAMDKSKAMRQYQAELGASHVRKLTTDGRSQLLEDRANGFTYKQLCEKYEIAKSTISYIVNKKTYKRFK